MKRAILIVLLFSLVIFGACETPATTHKTAFSEADTTGGFHVTVLNADKDGWGCIKDAELEAELDAFCADPSKTILAVETVYDWDNTSCRNVLVIATVYWKWAEEED